MYITADIFSTSDSQRKGKGTFRTSAEVTTHASTASRRDQCLRAAQNRNTEDVDVGGNTSTNGSSNDNTSRVTTSNEVTESVNIADKPPETNTSLTNNSEVLLTSVSQFSRRDEADDGLSLALTEHSRSDDIADQSPPDLSTDVHLPASVSQLTNSGTDVRNDVMTTRTSTLNLTTPQNFLSTRPPRTHSTVPDEDIRDDSSASLEGNDSSTRDSDLTTQFNSETLIKGPVKSTVSQSAISSNSLQRDSQDTSSSYEHRTAPSSTLPSTTPTDPVTTSPDNFTAHNYVIPCPNTLTDDVTTSDDVTTYDNVTTSDEVTNLAVHLAGLVIEEEEEEESAKQRSVCQQEVRLEPLPNRNVSSPIN